MAKTFMDADMDAELEEMEKDNEDSDDDDEDMEDSDEEEKEDPELLKQISQYKEELLSNPYNYNAHLQLVTLLRKTDSFDQLRNARKAFSECYPLTEELWTDWINDELKIASTAEEKKAVEDLFESGVKDYESVELWLEYCQHSIGGIGTSEGVAKARAVFERALTSCGRHIARGSLIWEAFREFESVSCEQADNCGQWQQRHRCHGLCGCRTFEKLLQRRQTGCGRLRVCPLQRH